jgi:tetratricopeptide (TPR) repeat protein
MRFLPTLLAPFLAALLLAAPARAQTPGFERAVQRAERALEEGRLDEAREEIRRAQERDPRSTRAWELRARWAEAAEDRDELVYALHRRLQLLVAQGAPPAEREALRARLVEIDAQAAELLDLEKIFLKKLLPLAEQYEKDGRPHSAIRVHKEVLALQPEHAESRRAIERIASAPDPSLAEDAKPKDLLADVSEEWIVAHDEEHGTWKERAKLERENYVTLTDAGYEVLVRAAEAMEQMNAFYRVFFEYGAEGDNRSVSPIELRIFANRDEYLELGTGPPVEWSGGQFTGAAVETYIGEGGFESAVGTLFHEAAHQFVSLATNAAGWLNEGLASFFEGCRILANGTVLMNMPANHRLFPLVTRMERGWMTDAWDGIDREEPSKGTPEKAPTFRIVLENEYPWGPPWYAPTWGVVYFLYNYQDPVDGRFLYRAAFRTFVDKSGGRMGEGAVENFEEVVLGNPAPPTKGVELPKDGSPVALPRTVAELDPVWRDWLTRLRDEQSGRLEVERPYHDWARYAVSRGDLRDALEHFEKGLVAAPDDVDLLADFADFLADRRKNPDRAAKLLLQAARLLEASEPVDGERLAAVDAKLRKVDPKRKSLERVRDEIETAVTGITQRYLADGLDMMAMDVAWRMGTDLQMPEMFEYFEEAARRAGTSLAIWKLAYDEQDLDGWAAAGNETFRADGDHIAAEFGEYVPDNYEFRFLTLDTVTSGDFSMEVELRAELEKVTFAGLVFGKKSDTDFHALLLYPPGRASDGASKAGYLDLASFYGDGSFKTWRHNPVRDERDADRSSAETWHRLRVDVAGRLVDVWLDGEYVATQEFPSLDVLRGAFGLITGTGEARYRNVRYLARAARDPGTAIERELRMEALGASGQSRNGSWLGMTPPFPEARRWILRERTSWQEVGPNPQLLVIWSIEQNEQIPIDGWLRWLAEEYGPLGLEIVSVVNAWDSKEIDRYLAEHPFPGTVALDRPPAKEGMGKTFETYAIDDFYLPRLLLLDVDHTVVWEGDPGFKVGVGWMPEEASYLEAPLQDLVERRGLRALVVWRERWRTVAEPALAHGDLAPAVAVLRQALELDWRAEPQVLEARTRWNALGTALDGIETTAEALAEAECEPALEMLLAWAELLERPLGGAAEKALRPHLRSGHVTAWKKALGMLSPLEKRLDGGKPIDDAAEVAERIARLGGRLPERLAEELTAAAASAEPERALARCVRDAPTLPARWLAREHFGW